MVSDEARWLRLERRPRETLRAAVERMLREAILDGTLRPGVVLPSSRALAGQLGVSRGVTTEAYGQLQAQGFVIARRKAVPVVADVPTPRRSRRAAVESIRPPGYDLSPTTPAVATFPARAWASTISDVFRTTPTQRLDYGDPRGERELRDVLADHLGRTRGVVTDPDQILVTQGVAQAIGVITRGLVARGADTVAVEDPGLDSQRRRIHATGVRVIGRPVDADGVVLDNAATDTETDTETDTDADAVVVTPAHQFPTGAVLSGARRRRLLAWARRQHALIIEDDYDAEFRYDQRPVRALQGLDPDRVAYLGSTSKTLAPALRLGWLVVPDELVDDSARIKHLLDVCSPTIDQLALARFIQRGHYDRHVRRARAVYKRRRDHLLRALRRHLPDLAIEGVAAGMHVLLRLPPDARDDSLVADTAAAHGVRVEPLSTHEITPSGRPALVIGYGAVAEDSIDDAVAALAMSLRKRTQRA